MATNPLAGLKKPEETKPEEATEHAMTIQDVREESFIFATRSIPNYRLGPWQFTDGQLILTDAAEAESLRKCIKALSPAEQLSVYEIDVAAAEALVRSKKPVASQGGTDSTELRLAMDAAKTAGATGL